MAMKARESMHSEITVTRFMPKRRLSQPTIWDATTDPRNMKLTAD